ncbi:MAG: permease-like cell division protein FtsX [Myxococcales bacterium]|nr:permease-like cell division protein FtsX [Myxococcales bacterium]MDD9964608.1 permease-like cell division protein FtsX [Myxococcales bacterium]
MDIRTTFARARRGFRDDLRLHVVAVASLVVAFLCLGAALLGVENLARVAERWTQSQHMTVYLGTDASESDIAQLRLVLDSLTEVAEVEYINSARARAQFAEQTEMGADVGSLPAEAFPASLELALHASANRTRITKIGERIKSFNAVEDVETYQDWFGQLGSLLDAGRKAVGILALLVAVCVVAVIGNTIRLAVANRRQEIEVLKLCGATDRFVRTPFIVEGILQGLTASVLSLVLLGISYLSLRGQVEDTVVTLTGMQVVFLGPLTVLGVVCGGGLVGALGSALSLRRYLSV